MSHHDSQVNLNRLFDALAARGAGSLPGALDGAIESRLRSACRARRIHRLRRRVQIGALGLAACLLLVFGWRWRVANRPVMPPETNYSGFLALPYAQSDVPIEQAIVVRVNLQPSDLEELGLPPGFVTGRKPTTADLLIGQDGVARAVRLAEEFPK